MEQEHMTLGQWILTIIITLIPCVNLVMLIVWAVSSNTNPSKKTWAQAQLIITVVIAILYGVCFAIFGASFAALASQYSLIF